jgi:hypothetical protein
MITVCQHHRNIIAETFHSSATLVAVQLACQVVLLDNVMGGGRKRLSLIQVMLLTHLQAEPEEKELTAVGKLGTVVPCLRRRQFAGWLFTVA